MSNKKEKDNVLSKRERKQLIVVGLFFALAGLCFLTVADEEDNKRKRNDHK